MNSFALAFVLVAASVASAADNHLRTDQAGRAIVDQITERIYLLQKEFELVVRQFNRIASGQLQSQVLNPAPNDQELEQLVKGLKSTRDQFEALLAPLPAEDTVSGRQAPSIPGAPSAGEIPFVGQLAGMLSGLGGQGAGLGQFVSILSGLTSQLQSLTRIVSGLTGGFLRVGGGEGGSNPLEQITSMLTGITNQLGSLTGVFRNLGR